MKPRLAIMENVATLLTRSCKTLAKIRQILISHNYNVQIKVMKSHESGVPQSRSRVILVAIRIDNAKRLLKLPTSIPFQRGAAKALLDRSVKDNCHRLPEKTEARARSNVKDGTARC